MVRCRPPASTFAVGPAALKVIVDAATFHVACFDAGGDGVFLRKSALPLCGEAELLGRAALRVGEDFRITICSDGREILIEDFIGGIGADGK